MRCGASCNPRNSNAGCGMPLLIEQAQTNAYVLAPHTDAALEKLQQLLAPFSIRQFYTDSWGAYLRLLDSSGAHCWQDQHPEDRA